MAHLTNFSFEFCYKIFTEDVSLLLLYHGAKKSKMTKNSNQGGGGPALILAGRLFQTSGALLVNESMDIFYLRHEWVTKKMISDAV